MNAILIIKLLRPHQWLKNLFVFLPLFFGRSMLDTNLLLVCVLAFFAFSFASSGIYCLNDICDVEADRKHSIKKNRPIASGAISNMAGIIIMVICFVVAFMLLYCGCSNGTFFPACAILLIYIILNIAYCFYLKRFAIVDVFTIAVGFDLRIFFGGVVTNIVLSHWIVLMTFLLALFIAFAKRRDDVMEFERTGVRLRHNVARYNQSFMNQVLCVMASITMICYIMYTVSDEVVARIGNPYLYTTSIFVLAGIIRYLQITIVDARSGSPTKILLGDKFIQMCIIAWFVVFAGFLYLKNV